MLQTTQHHVTSLLTSGFNYDGLRSRNGFCKQSGRCGKDSSSLFDSSLRTLKLHSQSAWFIVQGDGGFSVVFLLLLKAAFFFWDVNFVLLMFPACCQLRTGLSLEELLTAAWPQIGWPQWSALWDVRTVRLGPSRQPHNKEQEQQLRGHGGSSRHFVSEPCFRLRVGLGVKLCRCSQNPCGAASAGTYFVFVVVHPVNAASLGAAVRFASSSLPPWSVRGPARSGLNPLHSLLSFVLQAAMRAACCVALADATALGIFCFG